MQGEPVGNGAKGTFEYRVRLVSENRNQLQTSHAVFQPFTVEASGTYRLLFLAASAYGAEGVMLTKSDASLPTPYVLVQDLGLAPEKTVQPNHKVILGAPKPSEQPQPKRNYVKKYRSNWWKAYSNGSPDSSWPDTMPQGRYGNWAYNSLIGFPNMTADLAGAAITNMRVYAYSKHWYGQTGVASIGSHGFQSAPGSYSGGGNRWYESGGWGRGDGRWIQIPRDQWNSWKGGYFRGISFETKGNASYGYWSHDLTIEVSYTK